MVHVATPRPSIGSALGQALGTVGGEQFGYQRERGRTLNAIEEAKTAVNKAQSLPELYLALQSAAAGSEGAQRALGQAFPVFAQQFQRKKGAEEHPAGGKTEGKAAPVTSVVDLLPPKQDPNQGALQDPNNIKPFTLPYSEQDIANIRNLARQQNYTPEMEERFVNDAKEYNEIAKTRYAINLGNYNQQQIHRKNLLENQLGFEKYLRDHAKEVSENPDELALALKHSEEFQYLPSYSERKQEVINKYIRPYQAAKESLKKALKRPIFGLPEQSKNIIRKGAQLMVNEGQRPQLQLMIAEAGQGEVEEADLINPLSEKEVKDLGKFKGNFIDPLEYVTSIEPDSPKYQEQLDKGLEKRATQEVEMAKYLSKFIKPGPDYNHPGTNLLLVRKHIMDKGADWQTASKIIDEAISEGKIKLDPQQIKDYNKLAYPPLTGNTYLDTIMNNIMFPITGRQ